MQLHTRPTNRAGVVLLLVMVALVAHQTLANRPAAPLDPAVIATVDLERAFNALDAWADAQVRVEELANRYEEQRERKRGEIEQLEADLELFAAGSDAHNEAIRNLKLQTIEYQVFVEVSKRRLEQEQSKLLKQTYEEVKDFAQQLAQDNGYDVIIVDDSKVPLPESVVGEAEITRQISARRILFATPMIDVTDELVELMNQ